LAEGDDSFGLCRFKLRGQVFPRLLDQHRDAFRPAPAVPDRIFDFHLLGFCPVLEEDLDGIADGAVKLGNEFGKENVTAAVALLNGVKEETGGQTGFAAAGRPSQMRFWRFCMQPNES
jgi:hypothetical protein